MDHQEILVTVVLAPQTFPEIASSIHNPMLADVGLLWMCVEWRGSHAPRRLQDFCLKGASSQPIQYRGQGWEHPDYLMGPIVLTIRVLVPHGHLHPGQGD